MAKRCLSLWICGWLEKFNEISLSEKEDFCSHFSTEDITYADYALVKTVCKDFLVEN